MSNGNPLIQLEQNAMAPVLRYDIPEPTSYKGQSFIELQFEDGEDIFTQSVFDAPADDPDVALRSQPTEMIRARISSLLGSGLSTELGVAAQPVQPSPVSPSPGPTPLPHPGGSILDHDAVIDIASRLENGERLVVGENLHGGRTVTTVPVPEDPRPRLYLIETIKLTSFLGDYGAGRVVKTFSLLPGESTRISIKTFKQRESTRKESSSVLDSFTNESATDLEKALLEEQSDQRSYRESFEYYADVKANASWGWGGASVAAGVKGGTNSAREEATKNISSATEKHTSRASAKREVEINTSFEVSEKEGEETSVEREIENINLSRTLNFVFRQMNQAFISFLHLTSVRVGYFDGRRESRLEVPISDLDTLLAKVIKAGRRKTVRDAILAQLSSVRDYQGTLQDVLDEIQIGAGDSYVRFNNELEMAFADPETGKSYTIPGVILAVNKYVMRTEGVIVEALLGEGDALDEYARELQDLEVQRRTQEVAVLEARAARERLVNDIAEAGDEAKAKVLERLTCPCKRDAVGETESDTP